MVFQHFSVCHPYPVPFPSRFESDTIEIKSRVLSPKRNRLENSKSTTYNIGKVTYSKKRPFDVQPPNGLLYKIVSLQRRSANSTE